MGTARRPQKFRICSPVLDVNKMEKLSAEYQLGLCEILRCQELVNIAITYRPASIRDRGSRRSRSASPTKLKASTANITVTAGNKTRCGASNRCERASFNMDPQLAVGGGTPRPRKLIVASARTAPAIPI